MSEKKLIILEKDPDEGLYRGYVLKDVYERVFDVKGANALFHTAKRYADDGFSITYKDKTEEKAFMEHNQLANAAAMKNLKEVTIWRYTSSPFSFGRSQTPIATKVTVADYDFAQLDKGFAAIVIHQGVAKGVYELRSGGLIGDTVAQVNDDINACDDWDTMWDQIKQSAEARDKSAKLVSNEEFGLPTKS